MSKKIALIGVASGWGAQIINTQQGPKVLKDQGLASALQTPSTHIYWRCMLDASEYGGQFCPPAPTPAESFPLVRQVNEALAARVIGTVNDGEFPVIIGGDHAIAVGTWSGIVSAHNMEKNFGLLWVDAHMDAHTPETTPSMAYHGMPVAALLGHGNPDFVNCIQPGAKLDSHHVVLLGVRSFEPEEEALLRYLGVRVITMAEIRKRGFEPCFYQALEIVQKGTHGFGISLDLDGFDPRYAPGVGSPEPGGLRPQDVLPQFEKLRALSKFKGMEIVEFNPCRDQKNLTGDLVKDILLATFSDDNTQTH